ncbi:alpha-amylase family glycosyl hydrolase [Haloferacaceae archaeon DSL9]
MNGTGPPRFTSVGDPAELAPWNPDPDESYRWRLVDAPRESAVSIPETPVVRFNPDVPGTYRFELETAAETTAQTVRAFPDERRSVRVSLPFEALDEPVDEIESISIIGPFNDQTVGRTRPRRSTDAFVADLELPPGERGYAFCPNDDLEAARWDAVTVPGPGRPRVRLDADLAGDAVVVTATATAAPNGECADADLDVEFVLDDRDPLSRDDIERDGNSLRVPTDALRDRTRIHAVAVGERYSVADVVAIDAGTRDGVSIDRPNDPPAWAESPTVYEIFVRSFAGDTLPTTFEEIERRIPYLESLCVDVLWLTPVLASPTDHGYHITDYFATADDLGSRAALESLVERCHGGGIRVVFDLVINHTSRDHPAFQLHSAGVPAYADHYRRMPSGWDATGVDWAGEGAPEFYFNWQRIPNLNYESLAVRRWMLTVVDEWAAVVDGFRCDVAWGVSHCFWKEVRDRVPGDFLLLDETIPRDPAYHEAEFHMHYDTTLYETLRSIGRGDDPAAAVFDALEDARTQGFPDSAVHLRYVENHDEDRYLAECDETSLRAAAAVTFTLPGAPMVYYGQERGMTDSRGPMRWHDGDAALTEYHRSLARLRRDRSALRTGTVERVPVSVDGPADRAVAFARETDEERLIVVVNFAADPVAVELDETVDSTDLLTDADVSATDRTAGPTATVDSIRVRDVAIVAVDPSR